MELASHVLESVVNVVAPPNAPSVDQMGNLLIRQASANVKLAII